MTENPWESDKLEYSAIGRSFTNLVKSIDTGKVISIEAGFGRGKTFFRTAWAQQLRSEGEIVVEVDVQQSDHSGDPVITLLGALVEALPKDKVKQQKVVFETAQKIGSVGAKALARALLKSGADEVFEAISEKAVDKLEDFDALDGFIKDVGSEMSKVAGQLIASQLATEKVRKSELPEQLALLQKALVEGSGTDRVVILVDELDRCHPEYAISFLEAAKLVFNQTGFIFCLMINASYLESLAQHRFGVSKEDEKYLDKFVDLRLKLEPSRSIFGSAVYELASELPLKIPYGDDPEFLVPRAADLARNLAIECGFSMRKVERILLRVELALGCYSDRPLDAPLLVFMAFSDESPEKVVSSFLPRSFLTPEEGEKVSNGGDTSFLGSSDERQRHYQRTKRIEDKAPELLRLPLDRYSFPDPSEKYHPWAIAFCYLAPHYIPDHRSVLDSVASLMVHS